MRPHDDPTRPAASPAGPPAARRHGQVGRLPHGVRASRARVPGNDRALAEEVGEALLHAGLLAEKPSVGQRHVFLNSAARGDIRSLIDDGVVPSDLRLP